MYHTRNIYKYSIKNVTQKSFYDKMINICHKNRVIESINIDDHGNVIIIIHNYPERDFYVFMNKIMHKNNRQLQNIGYKKNITKLANFINDIITNKEFDIQNNSMSFDTKFESDKDIISCIEYVPNLFKYVIIPNAQNENIIICAYQNKSIQINVIITRTHCKMLDNNFLKFDIDNGFSDVSGKNNSMMFRYINQCYYRWIMNECVGNIFLDYDDVQIYHKTFELPQCCDINKINDVKEFVYELIRKGHTCVIYKYHDDRIIWCNNNNACVNKISKL